METPHPSFSTLSSLQAENSGPKSSMSLVALFAATTLPYNPTLESGFQCASCGEWNVTSVDQSAGRRQRYVEDCQVCCKPNVLRVEYDSASQEFLITAELE